MKGRAGGPGGNLYFDPFLSEVLEEKRRLKRSVMERHARTDARARNQNSISKRQAWCEW